VTDSPITPNAGVPTDPDSKGLPVSQIDLPTGVDVPVRRRSRWKLWTGLCVLGLLVAAGDIALDELTSSKELAPRLAKYAGTLNYTVESGPSDAVRYPVKGPFDSRLGYVKLPEILQRLQSRDMEVESQAQFSPALLNYTQYDLFPPYNEKNQAGLQVQDCRGDNVYDFRYPQRNYGGFNKIPDLVVNALLFIENRDLLDTDNPYVNPAVDWVRFTRAAFGQVAKAVGIKTAPMGGSTLATQIEKYRHSEDGITSSIKDKLLQMASASIRIYRQGEQTLPARQQLVLNYVNTVPLSAAPGYGEVNGLGDGLWVWLGADFDTVNSLLSQPDAGAEQVAAKGLALRQVIALMIAHRKPSWYLGTRGRTELKELTDSYLRILAKASAISPALRDAGLKQQISFRDSRKDPAVHPAVVDKGANFARNRLGNMLATSLYDLDRMDMNVAITLQHDLQRDITDYLEQLRDPKQAAAAGILGERLLTTAGAPHVNYSFTLFERTDDGNRVRVQTDNTSQPFDINEGSKLELGSTAKLRVMSSYLEIITELHQHYSTLSIDELNKVLANIEPMDLLSRWALDYLITTEDRNLPAMLQAALDRRYSANPGEAFFTGGGLHRFNNFKREDNGREPMMREALRESINLPFVRLMRDIVRYSTYHGSGGQQNLMKDDSDPRRKQYLERFADREGMVYLQRFWRKYQKKAADEQLDDFLDGRRQNPTRLAAVQRYLHPEQDAAALGKFLHMRLPEQDISDKIVNQLYKQFAPGSFSLPDQGYVARVHPLELWLLGYLQQNPTATLTDITRESAGERQEVYGWLFRTRAKNARDVRIRIMLEVEAFSDIHARWKRLGYPFDHLVPSLGTALGSSGDRPAALAELMGIITNDGVRLPTIRVDHLHFAEHTPYDTSVRRKSSSGQRVMNSDVAAAIKGLLQEVVENGTARRLAGGYVLPDGSPLIMGGKTGTGDNRIATVGAGGARIRSHALSRTATFVFFLGERHFGTLTAFIAGSEAGHYTFTSALPVQVLRSMSPILQPYLEPGKHTMCSDGSDDQVILSASAAQ